MSIFNGIIAFVCIWWVLFFMVLPLGVVQESNPELGHDPGAPRKTHLILKMTITSLFAALLLGAWILWGNLIEF